MNVSRRVAVAASLGAMLSVQAGAAVAKHLFPLVGADGASLLRIGLVALQEVLRPVQLVAMACVIVASVGSTLSAKSPSP